jgi:hypothetical protein
MSRLVFDEMPETWPLARERVDAALRSLRAVLDRGFRAREQYSAVVDTVIDTDALPMPIEVPGLRSTPLSVMVLRATAQRTADGMVITTPAVTWTWRGGRVVIHAVGTLAAATRYDATIAVME